MVIEQFCSHGESRLEVREGIVFVEVTGPCNLEFFQEMASQLYALRTQLNLWNYSALVTFKGEALFTQDGVKFFIEYLKQINPTAIALNLEYVALPKASKHILQSVYSKARTNYYFFNCRHEAKFWLQSCMRRKKALNGMRA